MQENNLNFTQIKNWLPIFTSALIIAGAFYSVKTDIAVQTEKIEQMSQTQKDYLERSDNSDIKLNNHETRITVLESKKQSTVINQTKIVSAEPTIPTKQTPLQEQNQPYQPTKQKAVITDEKPEQKKDKPNTEPENEPKPSPISRVIEPILSILGVSQ